MLLKKFEHSALRAKKDDASEGGAPGLPPGKREELLANTDLETPRSTMRAAWKLLKPYWTQSSAKERAIAWSSLAVVLACTVWQVDLLVQFSDWQQQFGDIFQHAEKVKVLHSDLANKPAEMSALPEMVDLKAQQWKMLSTDFPILVGKWLGAVLTSFTLAQHLGLRWRNWMTDKFTNDWLDNKAFYHLQHTYHSTENPDQRIQEDVRSFTNTSLSLVTDALNSGLSLVAFSSMLWGLSGDFNLASLHPSLPDQTIPGFMFWAATAYAGIGTAITHFRGKTLAKMDYKQQRYEADYRSALIRVRENAQSVALYNGEEVEKGVLRRIFKPVVDNTKTIINKRKELIALRGIYNNLSTPLPYMMAAPLFFSGIASYGVLMKTAYAFGQVQGSMSWFIDNYQTLAGMKATVDRLGGFQEAIEKSNEDLAARGPLPPPVSNDNDPGAPGNDNQQSAPEADQVRQRKPGPSTPGAP